MFIIALICDGLRFGFDIVGVSFSAPAGWTPIDYD
jgi:hypothetical protein